MTNTKTQIKKQTRNTQMALVPVTILKPTVDFNQTRKGVHRYVVNGDNELTVNRSSLLNMKVARKDTSSTSALVPLFSAVKLTRIVFYADGETAQSTPPTFEWLSENSDGKNSKIKRGSTQTARTVLVPNGRAAMWSNASSSSTTLTENLFKIENCDNVTIDVYFDYVETAGNTSTLSATVLDATGPGIQYPALDSSAAGALTVGNWKIEPVVGPHQKLEGAGPPGTFVRTVIV